MERPEVQRGGWAHVPIRYGCPCARVYGRWVARTDAGSKLVRKPTRWVSGSACRRPWAARTC
eukprot:8526627-Alexandrium_andersonii.AAC.1